MRARPNFGLGGKVSRPPFQLDAPSCVASPDFAVGLDLNSQFFLHLAMQGLERRFTGLDGAARKAELSRRPVEFQSALDHQKLVAPSHHGDNAAEWSCLVGERVPRGLGIHFF